MRTALDGTYLRGRDGDSASIAAMDTNTSNAGSAPAEDPAASWTNETLSMPVRRPLLDREVRKVIEGKRARSGQSDGHSHEAADGGEHPNAQGDEGEHAS